MALARIASTFNTVLERTASVFYGIGSGVLAVLMVFTFADVALRYFFGSPVQGGNDISSYMMALVIPSGLALAALQKKHIRVDIFTMLLPKRVQDALSVFAYLLTLGYLAVVIWQLAVKAQSLIESGTGLPGVPVPQWPFVIAVTVFFAVFILVVFRDLIRYVVETVRPSRTDTGEDSDVTS